MPRRILRRIARIRNWIAALTGTPLGTVKTRLELGLRKLTNGIRPLRHKI